MARVYRERFLRRLRAKVAEKARAAPVDADRQGARAARTFREFDDDVTAPLHGFASAEDYWTRSSAGPLVAGGEAAAAHPRRRGRSVRSRPRRSRARPPPPIRT